MKVIFKDGTILERKDIYSHDGFISYQTNHKLKGTSTITHLTHEIPISNIKEIIREVERTTQF